MEQVKREAEANEKLKADLDQVRKATEKMGERSARGEEQMGKFGENLKSMSSQTAEKLKELREKAAGASAAYNSSASQAFEKNENLKKAREVFEKGSASAAAGSHTVLSKARGAFDGIMDKSGEAFGWLGDSDKKSEKWKAWKAAKDVQDAMAKEAAEAAAKDAAAAGGDKATSADGPDATAESNKDAGPPPEAALVVSQERTSSWDRFGANLRDMPFLQNVFENPLFDRVFGESEIAASIREMKEIDYNFHLEDFTEDMEYIISPHIIKSYLEGDSEELQLHCGEAAFLAVNASIKARKQQKLSLDTSILAGPKELELKACQRVEKGPPLFVWMFNMQQVNCLRDANDDIVEGAVDDIRNVHYAMVVTRHPEPDTVGLQYPWQISELAIVGNFPCW